MKKSPARTRQADYVRATKAPRPGGLGKPVAKAVQEMVRQLLVDKLVHQDSQVSFTTSTQGLQTSSSEDNTLGCVGARCNICDQACSTTLKAF